MIITWWFRGCLDFLISITHPSISITYTPILVDLTCQCLFGRPNSVIYPSFNFLDFEWWERIWKQVFGVFENRDMSKDGILCNFQQVLGPKVRRCHLSFQTPCAYTMLPMALMTQLNKTPTTVISGWSDSGAHILGFL